jgi:hypothetical protein
LLTVSAQFAAALVTAPLCDDTVNCSVFLSLYCSPLQYSGTSSMNLHCTTSLSRGRREVRWEGASRPKFSLPIITKVSHK